MEANPKGTPKLAFAREKKKDTDRLALESSAALAKNMSYGQYKAMQREAGLSGPTKPPTPLILDPKAKFEVTCTVCGKIYMARSHGRKFCSEACKKRAYREKDLENMGLPAAGGSHRICAHCGRPIVNRPGATKYCSVECCQNSAMAAYKQRQKEAQEHGTV